MRIIGGRHKRILIHPPANLPVRPTTDKAKEALFNVLQNVFDFEAIRVLDLFAGTGSISYEFASRGAVKVVAVENHPRCLRFIRQTKEQLGLENLICLKADVFRFLKYCQPAFDIVFADPPYDMEKTKLLPDAIFSQKLLAENGWLIIEHSSNIVFDNHPNFVKKRKYSKVHFSFFE